MGKKISPEELESLKENHCQLIIDSDGNLKLSLFGDMVTDDIKLTGLGVYSMEDYPWGLIWWEFNIEHPFYESIFNIKKKKNVSKFLSLPKETPDITVNFINSEGISVGGRVFKHPDLVQALQTIWSNPKLDWSEYDDKTDELIKGLRERSMELGGVVNWFVLKK